MIDWFAVHMSEWQNTASVSDLILVSMEIQCS